MSGSEQDTAPGGKKTRLALRMSLALNLFLAAAAIGYLALHGYPDRGRDRGGARAFFQSLPAELQEEAKAYRRARGGAYRDRREAIDAARDSMLTALRAEPFNRETFATAQQAEREVLAQARTVGDEAMADFAAKLSQQQRAALADALAARFEARRRRWEERRRRRGDD